MWMRRDAAEFRRNKRSGVAQIKPTSPEFPVVRTYSSRLNAEIAQQFLDSHGVSCFVDAADVGGMYPGMSFDFSGIRLVVSDEEEYSRARVLLEELDEAKPLSEEV